MVMSYIFKISTVAHVLGHDTPCEDYLGSI